MPDQKMKAVVCLKYGTPDVLKLAETQKPFPKADELLIRIKATAVNSGDARVRGLSVSGLMRVVMRLVLGFSKPRQPILGTVLSGVIEEVGSQVKSFKPGDQVFAMTGFKFGTYAEYITLKEKSPVALKPEKATFEESAAIIFGGSTAIHFLEKAKIGSNSPKTVLIYGATGAVGTSAIQIAKYYGAEVTAVCSELGMGLVKSLGADETINYTKVDFTNNGRKYDIVFDAVGKTSKRECAGCLTKDGIFITVGGMDIASETKEQLLLLKELFDTDQLNAVIDKTFTLDEIVDAHRYVDAGRKKGNVVISV